MIAQLNFRDLKTSIRRNKLIFTLRNANFHKPKATQSKFIWKQKIQTSRFLWFVKMHKVLTWWNPRCQGWDILLSKILDHCVFFKVMLLPVKTSVRENSIAFNYSSQNYKVTIFWVSISRGKNGLKFYNSLVRQWVNFFSYY